MSDMTPAPLDLPERDGRQPYRDNPSEPADAKSVEDDRSSQDPSTHAGLGAHSDRSQTDASRAGTTADQQGARRSVEWVRPTDLISRVSARAAERGVEWNVHAHDWTRTQSRAGLADVRAKAARVTRTMTTRLTRTGPEISEPEPARL